MNHDWSFPLEATLSEAEKYSRAEPNTRYRIPLLNYLSDLVRAIITRTITT